MKILSLAAGAAALALTAGSALAEKPAARAATAGPPQPIPYDQLDTYLKGSIKPRAMKDHSSPEAPTGVSADTSAVVKRPSESRASPPGPEAPPVDSPESGTVNPSPAPDTTSPAGVTPPDGSPRPR